jgi:hypothetical protein
LNARIESFKSLVSMAVNFPDCERRFGHFADGGEPVSNGNALPIAVILRFLFFATGNFACHSVWIRNRLSSSAVRNAGDAHAVHGPRTLPGILDPGEAPSAAGQQPVEHGFYELFRSAAPRRGWWRCRIPPSNEPTACLRRLQVRSMPITLRQGEAAAPGKASDRSAIVGWIQGKRRNVFSCCIRFFPASNGFPLPAQRAETALQSPR